MIAVDGGSCSGSGAAGVLDLAAGCPDDDGIVAALAEAGARDRRVDADPAAIDVGLVAADDAIGALVAGVVLDRDVGSEEHARRVARRLADHGDLLEPPGEE